MSDAAFEGLEGLAQQQAESYTSTTSTVDPGLVGRIGQLYADTQAGWNDCMWHGGWHGGERIFSILAGELKQMLTETGRIGDIPSLLCEAAGTVRWLVGDAPVLEDDLVVSPLIQALYSLGHNDFMIDLGWIFKGETPAYSIRYLAGTEEKPLRIACSGNAGCVANRVERCDLRYTGDTQSLGTAAKDSRLVAKGAVGDAGMCADNTEFHLPSVESLITKALVFGEGSTYYVDDTCIDSRQRRSLWRSMFWYTNVEKETPLVSIEPLRLIAHRLGLLTYQNHLYIPRENGKWTEVVP